MPTTHRIRLLAMMLIIGLSGVLVAAPFVPPAEGPVPFRRSQIPMNVDDIRELSEYLVRLAENERGESPESRRSAAQMLAVSLALNPVNADARRLVREYENERFGRLSSGKSVGEIRDVMMRQVDWLQAALAGEDANALANCLKDVLRGSGNGIDEKGIWGAWVSDLASFKDKTSTSEEDPFASDPKENPFDNPRGPSGGHKPDPNHKFELTLAKSGIITPIWHSDGNGGWALKPSLIEMAASQDKSSQESFALNLGNEFISERWDNYANWIEGIMQRKLGELPRGVKVNISGNQFEQSLSSNKSQAISAPVAVLANAAIVGRETDGIVIGKLNENGDFLVPTEFWPKLQAFGKGNGERMVLPAGSQPYMDAMLALEKPEFFLQYEVVYASKFEELAKATMKLLDDDAGQASEQFKIIQKHADPNNVRRYITNAHVKKRLMDVIRLDPNHVSAKMLLIQGNGERPTRIPRAVLASEIRRIIEPVAGVKALQYYELEEGLVRRPDAKAIYDLCDDSLDALERYVDRDDKELHKQADDLLGLVRELDRALGSRGSFHETISGISRTTRSVADAYRELSRVLDQEIGK